MPRIIPSKIEFDALTIRAGDTVTFPTLSTFNGYISSGGTEVMTFIPLSRPVAASSVTVSAGSANFRQNGNYLKSSFSLMSGYSSRMFRVTPGGIIAQFILSGGWGGTNNDLVSVQLTSDMTLTFS